MIARRSKCEADRCPGDFPERKSRHRARLRDPKGLETKRGQPGVLAAAQEIRQDGEQRQTLVRAATTKTTHSARLNFEPPFQNGLKYRQYKSKTLAANQRLGLRSDGDDVTIQDG